MWSRSLSFILWWLLLFTIVYGTPGDVILRCPEQCLCSTTEEGLHKAVCTSLSSLLKYSERNRHHNIHIINLHGAGVVKIDGELDKFTEVVSLDLSSNKIEHIDKLMKTSTKLTHVNLSENKLEDFLAASLPSSVSSLDLRNNLLRDVPSHIPTLPNLGHLLLSGNRLECSCRNLQILEHISARGIVVDDAKCFDRFFQRLVNWKSTDINHMCSVETKFLKEHDEMMTNQPIYAEVTDVHKHVQLADSRDLNAGEVFESPRINMDTDDNEMFLHVSKKYKRELHTEEGSGDDGSSNDDMEARIDNIIYEVTTPANDEMEGSGSIPEVFDTKHEFSTVDPDYYESSGDGETYSTTTEPFLVALNPLFSGEDVTSTGEPFDTPEAPRVFKGDLDWDGPDPEPTSTTAMIPVKEPEIAKETKHSDAAAVGVSHESMSEDIEEAKPAKSQTGTYICIGLLLLILVTLVGVVIVKNVIRKRRDKRYIRQQKKDIEKGGKEMVEMNKSLLGKPVAAANEPQKKVNGNYELVPTHDPTKKNGTLDSKKSVDEVPIPRIDVPKETATNPNNNVLNNHPNDHSHPEDAPDSMPYTNGRNSPHLNGRYYPEPNLLGPSEYAPVYDPDQGRVRIKMTETPKPKTPVLVTRSRSNAGDIIITPVSEEPGSTLKNST